MSLTEFFSSRGDGIMSLQKSLRSARPASIAAAIIGAAGIAALLAPAISAQADVPAKQKMIEYQDLDLTHEEDVQRLYSRLRSAARSVCGNLNGRTQFERTQYRQCFDQSLNAAVTAVNLTQLSKLHGSNDKLRIAQRR
jgi:UrcA family protein